jgi:hypothetical protein
VDNVVYITCKECKEEPDGGERIEPYDYIAVSISAEYAKRYEMCASIVKTLTSVPRSARMVGTTAVAFWRTTG